MCKISHEIGDGLEPNLRGYNILSMMKPGLGFSDLALPFQGHSGAKLVKFGVMLSCMLNMK